MKNINNIKDKIIKWIAILMLGSAGIIIGIIIEKIMKFLLFG